jgi:hypothetical protein
MKKRHGAEQIVAMLWQADVAFWGKGEKVPEVCKQLGISEADVLSLAHEVRRHGSAVGASAAGVSEVERAAEASWWRTRRRTIRFCGRPPVQTRPIRCRAASCAARARGRPRLLQLWPSIGRCRLATRASSLLIYASAPQASRAVAVIVVRRIAGSPRSEISASGQRGTPCPGRYLHLTNCILRGVG